MRNKKREVKVEKSIAVSMSTDKDDVRAHKKGASKSFFDMYKNTIEHIAEKWANAEKSDPFARQTVIAHFKNGVATSLDDYAVDFKPVTVELEGAFGSLIPKEGAIRILRPHSMKRP